MSLDDLDMDEALKQISDELDLDAESNEDEGAGSGDDSAKEPVVEPKADDQVVEPKIDEKAPEAKADDQVPPAQTPPAHETQGAPKTWRKEAAAIWDSIPPAAQAEIRRREEDIFNGIKQYKADATTGKAFQDAIAPYVEIYKQNGIDPLQHTRGFFEAHMLLSQANVEKKVEMFQKLAAHYGVPLQGLQAGTEYVDPQTAALQNKIQELEGRLGSFDQERATALRNQLEKELEAFASDPKNIYFNEVAGKVAQLLQQRKADSLAEAYEMAVWANPEIRARELQRLEKERGEAARNEDLAKAEAAKKAMAANVKTTAKSKSPSATAPVGTMDETLEATLAEIKSKG